jgi:hypothetical protein
MPSWSARAFTAVSAEDTESYESAVSVRAVFSDGFENEREKPARTPGYSTADTGSVSKTRGRGPSEEISNVEETWVRNAATDGMNGCNVSEDSETCQPAPESASGGIVVPVVGGGVGGGVDPEERSTTSPNVTRQQASRSSTLELFFERRPD